MEQTAEFAAMQEELNLLKGEIKAILQEVRTSVLARENPFTTDSLEAHAFSAAAATPPAAAVAPEASPEPETTAPEPIPLRPAVLAATVETLPETPAQPRPLSIHTLATLMSWTQETAERLNEDDLEIVLSLARYGGLIDTELQATLKRLAAGLALPVVPPKATITDFLLSLRQLDAIVREEPPASMDARPRRSAA